jgi:hypothetical protein
MEGVMQIRAFHIVLLAIILLGSMGLVLADFLALEMRGPYVEVSIRLLDESGREIPLGDYRVYAQIYALAPTELGGPLVEIFRGEVRRGVVRIYLEGVFKRIVENYANRYLELARGDKRALEALEGFTEMLNVNLWVEKGDVLVARHVDYISYSPLKLMRGEPVKRVVEIRVDASTPMALPSNRDVKPLNGPLCEKTYWWEVKWWVGLENMTYNEDYMRVINGRTYIKWPILIVENTYPVSSTLDANIAIFSTYASGVYFTIGIGFGIENKLRSGNFSFARDITLFKASDIKAYVAYAIRHLDDISAGQIAMYYIYARPYLVFLEEWVGYPDCPWRPRYPTGYQRVDGVVEDLAVESTGRGFRYVDGVEYRCPYWLERDFLFNSTLSSRVYVATLSSTRTIYYFDEFFQWYDTCDLSFEVPVSFAFLAIPLAQLGMSWAKLLAGITASFGVVDTQSVYVFGYLEIDNYVANELIYVRMSSYRFRKGSCEMSVPVVMYFESY